MYRRRNDIHSLLAVLGVCTYFANTLLGQTIINVPPDILNTQTIGSGVELNVLPGGNVAFITVDGGTVNVRGGEIDRFWAVNQGGSLTLQSGKVRNVEQLGITPANLRVEGGVLGELNNLNPILWRGNFTQTGGRIETRILLDQSFAFGSVSRAELSGGSLTSFSRSPFGTTEVILSGADFRINGQPVNGLESVGDEVDLSGTDVGYSSPFQQEPIVVTGTFSDGTPFAFANGFFTNDSLWGTSGAFSVTFRQTAVPPVPVPNIEISAPSDLLGIRNGQTARVVEGGVLPELFQVGRGATLQMDGGTSGEQLEVAAARVELLSGTIGNNYSAYHDSTTIIRGGELGNGATFQRGDLEVYGGRIGQLNLQTHSHATFQGGTIDRGLRVFSDAHLTLHLTDLWVDGVHVDIGASPGIETILPWQTERSLFGTLANGDQISLGPLRGDGFAINNITIQRAPDLPNPPAVVAIPGSIVPASIRDGQTLSVNPQGELPSMFRAGVDTTLIVNGGSVGARFEGFRTQVTLNNGEIGSDAILQQSQLQMFGGTVHDNLLLVDRSHWEMHGGTVPGTTSLRNSTAHISEGHVAVLHAIDSQVHLGNGASIDTIESNRGITTIGSDIGQAQITGHSLLGGQTNVDQLTIAPESHVDLVSADVTQLLTVGARGHVTLQRGSLSGQTQLAVDASLNLVGGSVHDVMGGTLLLQRGTVYDQPPRNPDEPTRGAVHVLGGELDSTRVGHIDLRRGTINNSSAVAFSIHGGDVLNGIDSMRTAADFLMYGTDFALDGVPVAGLNSIGDRLLIDTWSPQQQLTFTLRDGTTKTISMSSFGTGISPLVEPTLHFIKSAPYSPLDFNGDDSIGIDDLNQLIGEIAGPSSDLLFDITGDSQVTLADRDQWLEEAAAMQFGAGARYLLGDVDLDGNVDETDFRVWDVAKFTTTGLWSSADFNADGFTDVVDFNYWNLNKNRPSLPSATVPEPGSLCVLGVGSICSLLARRRIGASPPF